MNTVTLLIHGAVDPHQIIRVKQLIETVAPCELQLVEDHYADILTKAIEVLLGAKSDLASTSRSRLTIENMTAALETDGALIRTQHRMAAYALGFRTEPEMLRWLHSGVIVPLFDDVLSLLDTESHDRRRWHELWELYRSTSGFFPALMAKVAVGEDKLIIPDLPEFSEFRAFNIDGRYLPQPERKSFYVSDDEFVRLLTEHCYLKASRSEA